MKLSLPILTCLLIAGVSLPSFAKPNYKYDFSGGRTKLVQADYNGYEKLFPKNVQDICDSENVGSTITDYGSEAHQEVNSSSHRKGSGGAKFWGIGGNASYEKTDSYGAVSGQSQTFHSETPNIRQKCSPVVQAGANLIGQIVQSEAAAQMNFEAQLTRRQENDLASQVQLSQIRSLEKIQLGQLKLQTDLANLQLRQNVEGSAFRY